ncbi:hypothetical protein SNEBB_001700 [Seison nebaliae]|nr:hypothetical protein SNEBB_001700 [Seison nebaliae]
MKIFMTFPLFISFFIVLVKQPIVIFGLFLCSVGYAFGQFLQNSNKSLSAKYLSDYLWKKWIGNDDHFIKETFLKKSDIVLELEKLEPWEQCLKCSWMNGLMTKELNGSFMKFLENCIREYITKYLKYISEDRSIEFEIRLQLKTLLMYCLTRVTCLNVDCFLRKKFFPILSRHIFLIIQSMKSFYDLNQFEFIDRLNEEESFEENYSRFFSHSHHLSNEKLLEELLEKIENLLKSSNLLFKIHPASYDEIYEGQYWEYFLHKSSPYFALHLANEHAENEHNVEQNRLINKSNSNEKKSSITNEDDELEQLNETIITNSSKQQQQQKKSHELTIILTNTLSKLVLMKGTNINFINNLLQSILINCNSTQSIKCRNVYKDYRKHVPIVGDFFQFTPHVSAIAPDLRSVLTEDSILFYFMSFVRHFRGNMELVDCLFTLESIVRDIERASLAKDVQLMESGHQKFNDLVDNKFGSFFGIRRETLKKTSWNNPFQLTCNKIIINKFYANRIQRRVMYTRNWDCDHWITYAPDGIEHSNPAYLNSTILVKELYVIIYNYINQFYYSKFLYSSMFYSTLNIKPLSIPTNDNCDDIDEPVITNELFASEADRKFKTELKISQEKRKTRPHSKTVYDDLVEQGVIDDITSWNCTIEPTKNPKMFLISTKIVKDKQFKKMRSLSDIVSLHSRLKAIHGSLIDNRKLEFLVNEMKQLQNDEKAAYIIYEYFQLILQQHCLNRSVILKRFLTGNEENETNIEDDLVFNRVLRARPVLRRKKGQDIDKFLENYLEGINEYYILPKRNEEIIKERNPKILKGLGINDSPSTSTSSDSLFDSKKKICESKGRIGIFLKFLIQHIYGFNYFMRLFNRLFDFIYIPLDYYLTNNFCRIIDQNLYEQSLWSNLIDKMNGLLFEEVEEETINYEELMKLMEETFENMKPLKYLMRLGKVKEMNRLILFILQSNLLNKHLLYETLDELLPIVFYQELNSEKNI